MFADLILFDGDKFELSFDKVYLVKLFTDVKDALKCRDKIVVLKCDENNVQQALERKAANIILISSKSFRDHLHFRKSGLNQVACKLAKRNDIAVAFSFDEILNKKDRPLVLGRMMQNIRLCRKYSVNMVFASFASDKYGMRSANDLVSFAQAVGMTASEARKSLSFEAARKEISKGVRIVD